MNHDFHHIHRDDRPDGVCVLVFDRDGSSANLFDPTTLGELATHLDAIEHDTRVSALIFSSAKPKIFIAGADVTLFPRLDLAEAAKLVDLGQNIFSRIAALRVPTVAAIHGACVGGGLEMALACDWRVADDDPSTRLGLPEVNLGILPAWGGSTRLPRLVGLPSALRVILAAKPFRASQARRFGIVDEVVPGPLLMQTASTMAGRGKRRVKPAKWADRPPWRNLVAARARRTVLAKTHGHYPAPRAAIDVAMAATTGSVDASLARERHAFLELIRRPESRHLVSIFLMQERVKKPGVFLCERDADSSSGGGSHVRRVAVIGAGTMGAGIAQWMAAHGLSVILREVAAAPLGRGMAAIAGLFRDAVAARAMTAIEARQSMDRITPMVGEISLKAVDLVIEAVPEDLELKRRIFCEIEPRCGLRTVLATNTSALSIDDIAAGFANPERLVGIHFFNPVHRMQLVEMIHGRHTSPRVLAAALGFIRGIGKLPVVVRDSPGFLVNRILLPYLVEAARLVEQGLRVPEIDGAMVDFGMPMGPLRLCDEVGLDTALHVARDLEARLPHAAAVPDTLGRLVERGWLGRKCGRGFYLHPANARRPIEIREIVPDREKQSLPRGEIVDRLVLVMINEAARCLEEHLVPSADEIDFAMVMGTGWAPFRGGPLSHADALGADVVVARLEILARSVAPHFSPCALLRAMAAEGRCFHQPVDVDLLQPAPRVTA